MHVTKDYANEVISAPTLNSLRKESKTVFLRSAKILKIAFTGIGRCQTTTSKSGRAVPLAVSYITLAATPKHKFSLTAQHLSSRVLTLAYKQQRSISNNIREEKIDRYGSELLISKSKKVEKSIF